MDDRPLGIVLEHGHGFELGLEPMTARRMREPGLPAVEGVVVAVADERPDAGVMEPIQAIEESALGAKAAVRAVIDVSGHEQRVHLFADA